MDQEWWRYDSTQLFNNALGLLHSSEKKNDLNSSFALIYQIVANNEVWNKGPNFELKYYDELIRRANATGIRDYIILSESIKTLFEHSRGVMQKEKTYLEFQRISNALKSLDPKRLNGFYLPNMYFHMSQFMFLIGDYESMYDNLKAAEPSVRHTYGYRYITRLVYNYLEFYYEHKKDYQLALNYASKIYQFQLQLDSVHEKETWDIRYWKMFSLLDMARFNLELGKIEEGNKLAQLALQNSNEALKFNDPEYFKYYKLNGEFDALNLIFEVNQRLENTNALKACMNRSIQLLPLIDSFDHEKVFHHRLMKFFRNRSAFEEIQGNHKKALDYKIIENQIQDSIQIHADVKKLALDEQRLKINKYQTEVQKLQLEKKLNFWKYLSVIALFVSSTFLLYRKYLVSQKEKQQTLMELKQLTFEFQQKSKNVDQLQFEIDRLAAKGENSNYLIELKQATILTDTDWSNFKRTYEKAYPGFIESIIKQNPNYTTSEIRMLCLMELNLDNKEISNILGVNVNTVHKTQQRIRQKNIL